MSRFYVRPEDVNGDKITVPRKEAHHIADVMRLGPGDAIVAFDGTGREYIGRIAGISASELKVRIEKVNPVKDADKIHITLAQSLPKKAKMDFIVEKATELGVSEIIPMVTERTVVQIKDDKRHAKTKRWRQIAISAAKQCGRLKVPEVRPVARFETIVKEFKNYDLVFFACLHNDAVRLNDLIAGFTAKRVLALIGPEGDFTPEEIKTAKNAGARLVSLGKLVLRVDTAAIFVLSVLSYESKI